MLKEQFFKLCTVRHFVDFWAVRVADTQNLHESDIMEYMAEISSNTDLPVQFSSPLSHDIVWFYKGNAGNPYGPSLIKTENGQQHMEFLQLEEPNMVSSRIADNGNSTVVWDNTRLAVGKPTLVHNNRNIENNVLWGWRAYVEETKSRYSDKLNKIRRKCFPYQALVRNNHYSIKLWAKDVLDFNTIEEYKEYSPDRDGPSLEVDGGVYEAGWILDDGIPRYTKWADSRSYHWLSLVSRSSSATLGGDYSRQDGPARVTQFNIKTEIVGDKVEETVYGEDTAYEWFLDGTKISDESLNEWLSESKVKLAPIKTGYESAFKSDMDQMAFIANFG